MYSDLHMILHSSSECEKWFLTLGEEHKLQGFGNKIRKRFGLPRDEVTEQFRLLHNKNIGICTGQLVL